MSDVITNEAIQRLRARIGVAVPNPVPPRYLCPGTDAFRHVAVAYGDDNPLWCEPRYGRSTRWGGPIAPPPLVGGDSLVGEDEVREVACAEREVMRGDPLRGVHAFYSASAREWWAPLCPSARVARRNALVAVLDKPSDFAGRAVHEWTAQAFRVVDGPLLGVQHRLMIRAERSRARSRSRESEVEQEPYSNAEIAAIEEQYQREAPRGPDPRLWEDVREGDPLGPMVKGPLTVTDIVCWHSGMGMGLYGVAPLRLASRNRARVPKFYSRDGLNVPDAMQRVHWDAGLAQRSGSRTVFDYGRMRETWLVHLCTDWMGDDAWLWRLRCEFRRFNYVGDTQWLRGTVERRYLAEGGRPAVEVSLQAENQRGELTTPGRAMILLPSREHGPVQLPEPPRGAVSLQEVLDALAARFEER